MSAGTIVGSIVTLVGLIAGAAILAAHFLPSLSASLVGLWLVFVCGISAGISTALMFCETRTAGEIMFWSGMVCTFMALAAGLLAFATLLGLASLPSTLHLWMLALLALPTGGMLLMFGLAARKTQ